MSYVIIGSVALMCNCNIKRTPADIDIVTTLDNVHAVKNEFKYLKPFVKSNTRIEFHHETSLLWLLNNKTIPALYVNDNILQNVATLDQLYTIKFSHSFWNVNWEKTMHDIKHMQSYGTKLIPEFYQLLYNDWCVKHGSKDHINLNVKNEEFFNHYVDRQIDHDMLHKIMAYEDEPMHVKLKNDKSKAFMSKQKFFALSKDRQLNTCREEIQVIALERDLIPSNFNISFKIAYMRAIKRLITTMTRGWFAEYLVENYATLEKVDRDFVNVFKTSQNSML